MVGFLGLWCIGRNGHSCTICVNFCQSTGLVQIPERYESFWNLKFTFSKVLESGLGHGQLCAKSWKMNSCVTKF